MFGFLANIARNLVGFEPLNPAPVPRSAPNDLGDGASDSSVASQFPSAQPTSSSPFSSVSSPAPSSSASATAPDPSIASQPATCHYVCDCCGHSAFNRACSTAASTAPSAASSAANLIGTDSSPALDDEDLFFAFATATGPSVHVESYYGGLPPISHIEPVVPGHYPDTLIDDSVDRDGEGREVVLSHHDVGNISANSSSSADSERFGSWTMAGVGQHLDSDTRDGTSPAADSDTSELQETNRILQQRLDDSQRRILQLLQMIEEAGTELQGLREDNAVLKVIRDNVFREAQQKEKAEKAMKAGEASTAGVAESGPAAVECDTCRLRNSPTSPDSDPSPTPSVSSLRSDDSPSSPVPSPRSEASPPSSVPCPLPAGNDSSPRPPARKTNGLRSLRLVGKARASVKAAFKASSWKPQSDNVPRIPEYRVEEAAAESPVELSDVPVSASVECPSTAASSVFDEEVRTEYMVVDEPLPHPNVGDTIMDDMSTEADDAWLSSYREAPPSRPGSPEPFSVNGRPGTDPTDAEDYEVGTPRGELDPDLMHLFEKCIIGDTAWETPLDLESANSPLGWGRSTHRRSVVWHEEASGLEVGGGKEEGNAQRLSASAYGGDQQLETAYAAITVEIDTAGPSRAAAMFDDATMAEPWSGYAAAQSFQEEVADSLMLDLAGMTGLETLEIGLEALAIGSEDPIDPNSSASVDPQPDMVLDIPLLPTDVELPDYEEVNGESSGSLGLEGADLPPASDIMELSEDSPGVDAHVKTLYPDAVDDAGGDGDQGGAEVTAAVKEEAERLLAEVELAMLAQLFEQDAIASLDFYTDLPPDNNTGDVGRATTADIDANIVETGEGDCADANDSSNVEVDVEDSDVDGAIKDESDEGADEDADGDADDAMDASLCAPQPAEGLPASWAAMLEGAGAGNRSDQKSIIDAARMEDPYAQVALVHLVMPFDGPERRDFFPFLALRNLADRCELLQEAVQLLGKRAALPGAPFALVALKEMARQGHKLAATLVAQLEVPEEKATPPRGRQRAGAPSPSLGPCRRRAGAPSPSPMRELAAAPSPSATQPQTISVPPRPSPALAHPAPAQTAPRPRGAGVLSLLKKVQTDNGFAMPDLRRPPPPVRVRRTRPRDESDDGDEARQGDSQGIRRVIARNKRARRP